MRSKVDDRELAVARVYAQSLTALAVGGEPGRPAPPPPEPSLLEELLEELSGLAAEIDGNPELAQFLSSPLVDPEARRQVVERTLRGRATDLLVDTLQVMNRKGRLGLVPALVEAFRQEVDTLRGRIDVEVTTAVPLGEEARRRLLDALARVSGKRPRLTERVDAGILGGMVLTIGDRKIDYSTATDLRQLDDRLLERAAGVARRAIE